MHLLVCKGNSILLNSVFNPVYKGTEISCTSSTSSYFPSSSSFSVAYWFFYIEIKNTLHLTVYEGEKIVCNISEHWNYYNQISLTELNFNVSFKKRKIIMNCSSIFLLLSNEFFLFILLPSEPFHAHFINDPFLIKEIGNTKAMSEARTIFPFYMYTTHSVGVGAEELWLPVLFFFLWWKLRYSLYNTTTTMFTVVNKCLFSSSNRSPHLTSIYLNFIAYPNWTKRLTRVTFKLAVYSFSFR